MKGRMTFRLNKIKSPKTLQIYRSGWMRMWDFAPEKLTKWKIPKVGSWDPSNQMGGAMWATPAEFRRHPLSGNRLALVLETAFDEGCSAANLQLMRKTQARPFKRLILPQAAGQIVEWELNNGILDITFDLV